MGDELSLLPETRPDDVEDVVWGLQTATTLWGRGEKREALVWLRRAAEAAGAAGADVRAVELAKRAVELEQLFALQSSSSVTPPSAATPSVPPAQAKPPLPKPPVLAELLDADDIVDEETQERTLPGVAHGPGSIPPPAALPLPSQPAPAPAPAAAPAPAPSQAPPPKPALSVSPPAPLAPVSTPIARDEAALAALNKTQPLPIVAHPLASTQVSVPAPIPPSAAPPVPPKAAPSRPSTTALPAVSPPVSAPLVAERVEAISPPPGSVASAPRPVEPPVASLPAAQSAPPPSARAAPSVAAPSVAPVTPAPVTPAPAPVTPAPVTPAPVAPAPVTPAPVTPAPSVVAANKKKQRAPILDPWSDDIPDEPAPRTIGHRTDTFTDEDVMTSAPSIDSMLKRKAPPPPPLPMKRSATLTGVPDGPTLEAARSKLANLADDGAARTPAPPPTRKPTLSPSSGGTVLADARKSIPPPMATEERSSVPPPPLEGGPRSERASVPPPPPRERRTTPPPASGPSAPAAPLFGTGLPAAPPSVAPKEAKTDPPPATMPAAQQLANRQAAPASAAVATPPPAPPAASPPPAPPAVPPPAASAPATSAPTVKPEPPAGPTVKPEPPAAPTGKPEPPAAPTGKPEPPPTAPPAVAPAPPASPTIPPESRSVENLVLDRVEGFGDLPPEVQVELAKTAEVVALGVDEEVSGFGIALLLEGAAVVCPTIADAAAVALEEAGLAPALTTHPDGSTIRVVATMPSRVATWDKSAVEGCLRSCPWVLDDLAARGDRVAALTGATMGPLGDLDESSRFMTLSNLTVRSLAPGEILVAAAGEVPGLTIVGLGTIVQGDGEATFGSGDVVLAGSVLEGGPVPAEIKAGPDGALVLVATRMKTLELFSTIPSLIELLRVT